MTDRGSTPNPHMDPLVKASTPPGCSKRDTVASVNSIEDALSQACRAAGLPSEGARLLHAHSNAVWLLPNSVIARMNRTTHDGMRARDSVALTVWLAEHGIPVPEPAHDDAIKVDDFVVTFWHYYPQPDQGGPPPAALGAILRRLHRLPEPPIAIRPYVPLAGMSEILASPAASGLDSTDVGWLTDQVAQACEAYQHLDSDLGVGLVHGDAYAGNTLWGHRGVALLGDWDEVATAPRELDLINTFQSSQRFGTPGVDEFVSAYGHDPRSWPGFAVLTGMRDLHTLGAYIRRAIHGDRDAEVELRHRVRTLRDPGHAAERWHVIP